MDEKRKMKRLQYKPKGYNIAAGFETETYFNVTAALII